jgi:hypothetical protein
LSRYRVPIDQQPKCERCNKPRLKGGRFCPSHAGWRKADPSNGRFERNVLARMNYAGRLPAEITRLPVWRAMDKLPTSLRSPARLRLVLLWDKREAHCLAWTAALRDAQRLVDTHPGLSRKLSWYLQDA